MPADNPFNDGAGPNLDAIWVRGLRNPFRFAIDPANGRVIIGDVGEGTTRGGQRRRRAAPTTAGPTCEGSCGTAGMTNPVYSYPHSGRDASITAGIVYRGTQFPAEYRGDFFFGDYAQNWIKRITFDATGNVTAVRNFEPPDGSVDGPYGDIVGFAEGPDGSLWYVDTGPFGANNAGAVRRIRNISRQPAADGRRGRHADHRPGAARRRVLERRIVRPRGPAADLPLGLRRRHDVDAGEPVAHVQRGRPLHGSADDVGRHARDGLQRAHDHRGHAARAADPRAHRRARRSAPATSSATPVTRPIAQDGTAAAERAVVEDRVPPRHARSTR